MLFRSLFLQHYNEKYNKKENFFSNIKNIDKDTNNPMELFMEILVEFQKIKNVLNVDDDYECINYCFISTDDININKMFALFKDTQIYCLEVNNSKYISPSLLNCLYHIHKNLSSFNKNWVIYTLKDMSFL